MSRYFQDTTLEHVQFTHEPFVQGEYENCCFTGCNFSGAEMSGSLFSDCEFNNCNLSLAKISDCSFRDVRFKDCKMLGLHFDHNNPFGHSFSFEHCLLNDCSFFKTKIKKTVFKHCSMQHADFSECDLTGAVFDYCDMAIAIFDHTILDKADLRTSFNYVIDPENNKLKKAKFSLNGISGLLNKYDIEIEP